MENGIVIILLWGIITRKQIDSIIKEFSSKPEKIRVLMTQSKLFLPEAMDKLKKGGIKLQSLHANTKSLSIEVSPAQTEQALSLFKSA